MPQLVKGLLRFTDEDYLMSDFKEKVNERYGQTTYKQLIADLEQERIFLACMKDEQVLARFNTKANFKKSLTNSLALLTALAQKEGYELTDLLS
jgi:hypothetical protein